MDKPAQNIQDSFLNNARKDKIVLTIYLMSGVKLSGRIKSFDKYSLVLETNNQESGRPLQEGWFGWSRFPLPEARLAGQAGPIYRLTPCHSAFRAPLSAFHQMGRPG